MSLSVKDTKNRPRSPYLPVRAVVKRAVMASATEMLFTVAPEDASLLDYRAGQFFMVGLPGYGEAPISVTSPPGGARGFELCVRAAGNLTGALHRLKKGDEMTLRGPFGTSFPVEDMKGADLLFIAGGIGIVPMRSLIKTVLGRRRSFGKVTLVYGTKAPDEMLFKGEFDGWREKGLDMRLTIDSAHPDWSGHVGLVTTLLPGGDVGPKTIVVIIGPPVMYKFVIIGLRRRDIGAERIFVSLERRMKCGVGKCGHCQINSAYVCQVGPVFRLSDLKGLPEAL